LFPHCDVHAIKIVGRKSHRSADKRARKENWGLKDIDERTHPYAGEMGEFSQRHGNSKQVRQTVQDRRDSRAAGGDNERGLGYIPQGFNRRVAKPTQKPFEQWRYEDQTFSEGFRVLIMQPRRRRFQFFQSSSG
jgi:hypothetical protein